MLTSSRYLTAVSADRCSFCNTPFRRIDGYFEFWRTSNGRHFCSEFCADNVEEAHFREQHTHQAFLPNSL